MPNRCSVPGCRSNYDGEASTPCFQLPKNDELRKKWILALHREGIEELKTVFVCEKHFRLDDVLTTIDYHMQDGKIEKRPRKHALKQNAIPTIFETYPSYFQSRNHPDIMKRLDYREKEKAFVQHAITDSLILIEDEKMKYSFSCFQDLKLKLTTYQIPKSWIIWYSDLDTLHIVKPYLSNSLLSIEAYITITVDLKVRGFYNECQVPISLNSINDLRQLSLLIEEMIGYTHDKIELYIKKAENSLKESVSELEKLDDITDYKIQDLSERLHFIIGQLKNSLLPKNRRRYNLVTLALSLKSQLISPACYKYIQSLSCLSLPHPSTLRRLYSSVGLETEYLSFLKISVKNFEPIQRNVTLHIDEIHIKGDLTYKGGKIYGTSNNSEIPAATTVFCFMISSLFHKWSTVVRLLPCSSNSADNLFPILKQVIQDVESCDLFVHLLCADNYPLNEKLFKLFSPYNFLETSVQHPSDPSRSLFLIFDFVHIIKSIRNNWINQRDYKCTFIYPSFDDFSITAHAKFNEIRQLFKSEQIKVVKQAHRLTSKACWPTSLERQNVSLALRIFDSSTCRALKIQQFSDGTADFIEILNKVWTIFNINTPVKGIRLRDEFSMPLLYDDSRFAFLAKIVEWLDIWRNLPGKYGKLSAQTFNSFRQASILLPKLVNHLINKCSFTYVMSSRLQNDIIEHHFGLYRMMSGAQYNVSLLQILESERRIKLASILKLFEKQHVETPLSLKLFFESFYPNKENESVSQQFNLSIFADVIEDDIEYQPDTATLQSLVFISGYAVHSCIKNSRQKCADCISSLTLNKSIEFDEAEKYAYLMIQLTDRGSLKWPSPPVTEAIVTLWNIYMKIENNSESFAALMKGPSRSILEEITLQRIESNDSEFWRYYCSGCCSFRWDILRNIIKSTSNCILSNKVNNMNSTSRQAAESRKIKKFKST